MNKEYRDAARYLRQGEIVAYPTEAVFGLGCDPSNQQAVEALCTLKQRALSKGVILIAARLEQLQDYLNLADMQQYPQTLASWPGPYTWLMPCKENTPRWLRGEHASLAVRITANQSCIALCNAFAGPIVSTSANLSGKPPCLSAAETRAIFADKIGYILDGATDQLENVTPIRDALTGQQIR